MPTRYSKKGELQQLQYEITNEISRDAQPIARGVFGDNARHPDMASVSNAELDRIYAAAFARGDRQFLMQEAQRDPQQFLDVTDRLGVPDPPPDMSGQPSGVDPNALQKALTSPPTPAPSPQPVAGSVPPVPAAPSIPLPPPSVAPTPPPQPTVAVQPQLPGM